MIHTVNENLWILHRFIPLNIIQTAWNVTSLQEADKSRTGLCDSVMKSKLTSIMKNPFAENFLSREKRTFDNSIIPHSFRWKCFIQRLNVNAVKESWKKYTNFVIFDLNSRR